LTLNIIKLSELKHIEVHGTRRPTKTFASPAHRSAGQQEGQFFLSNTYKISSNLLQKII
jgi:hypothetical protein